MGTCSTRGRPPKKENQERKQSLKRFYVEYYTPTISPDEERPSFTRLTEVLDCTATDIMKDYENNIKALYFRCVDQYVRTRFGRGTNRSTLSKEDRSYYDWTLRQVRNDILAVCGEPLKAPEAYDAFVEEARKVCLPGKYFTIAIEKMTPEQLKHHATGYDVKGHPWDYFEPMYRMILEVELSGCRTYNLFPQCSSQVPGHIRIDSTAAYELLMDSSLHDNKKSCSKVGEHKDEIWSTFFRTEMRCFRKGPYTFKHTISTDGVSVSVLLIHNRYAGKNRKATAAAIQKDKKDWEKTLKVRNHKGFYITDHEDLASLVGKTIVAIDPGKSDLLSCVTVPEGVDPDAPNRRKNVIRLRYTQNQRRHEIQIKKRRKLTEKWKQAKIIDGRSVVEWEASLAKNLETNLPYSFHSRSIIVTKYQQYLRIKNHVTQVLAEFYADLIYRKFRLHTYSNTQRSESNFMNRFRKTFGTPDKVIVGIGDWSEYRHRRGHEPLKGVGFHGMIRRPGYELALVNEKYTSKMCSNCKDGSECKYCRKCKNPRPWKRDGPLIDRHGLVMCQTCGTRWNRDVNAPLNMYHVIKEKIAGRERPEYLKHRQSNRDHVTSNVPNTTVPARKPY